MRAVVVSGPGRVAVEDVPEPSAGDGALVEVEVSGVCGTDLKIVEGGIRVDYPRVIGHEVIGRVVEPGPHGLIPQGTRVLVDPSVSCGHCRLCRADLADLCPNGALIGRDVDGGFAERVAVDEDLLLPVPDALPTEEAALLQVLGTCVHAQAQVGAFPGQAAAVVGLGVSGLLHLQLLLARGIRRVVGVTRSSWKRELAARLGATAVAAPQDAGAAVAEVTGGEGAELVVEAVGKPDTLAQAIELAALGGTILVFGTITATSAERFPFYQLYYKELTLVNPRAALTRDYARGIGLAAEGRVRLAPLFARSHPLEEAPEAIEALRSGASDLKVAFRP